MITLLMVYLLLLLVLKQDNSLWNGVAVSDAGGTQAPLRPLHAFIV